MLKPRLTGMVLFSSDSLMPCNSNSRALAYHQWMSFSKDDRTWPLPAFWGYCSGAEEVKLDEWIKREPVSLETHYNRGNKEKEREGPVPAGPTSHLTSSPGEKKTKKTQTWRMLIIQVPGEEVWLQSYLQTCFSAALGFLSVQICSSTFQQPVTSESVTFRQILSDGFRIGGFDAFHSYINIIWGQSIYPYIHNADLLALAASM